MVVKRAPLSSTFMIVAIVGFLIAAFFPKISDTWRFTLLLFFAVMFISAFISMTKAPVPAKEFRKKR